MKKKTLLLLICGMLFVSGCTQNETDNSESESSSSDSVAIEIIEEKLLNLDVYSVEEKESEYSHPEFLDGYAAGSENGIYYWSGSNGVLMFYDKASQMAVPLCNRPDCTHSDNKCNAAFNRAIVGESIVGEDTFYKSHVYYYEGDVYLLGHDSTYTVNLYKVAANGSSWEKYMTLYKADTSYTEDGDSASMSIRVPNVCIHRGYVYFIDQKELTPKVRRIKLGGTEVEVIYDASIERTRLYRMQSYGDFIFFQISSDDENVLRGICAYNVQTGEVILIKKEAIATYVVVDENLYYSKDEKVNKYSLVTGENTELPIVDGFEETLFVDDKGVYTFNDVTGELIMYNYDGVALCDLKDSNISRCYFGADGIFFAEGTGIKAFLEVESLLNGDGKWIYIE